MQSHSFIGLEGNTGWGGHWDRVFVWPIALKLFNQMTTIVDYNRKYSISKCKGGTNEKLQYSWIFKTICYMVEYYYPVNINRFYLHSNLFLTVWCMTEVTAYTLRVETHEVFHFSSKHLVSSLLNWLHLVKFRTSEIYQQFCQMDDMPTLQRLSANGWKLC